MNQYYYKDNTCKAKTSDHPSCICWHTQGEGPFPEATPDDSSYCWRNVEHLLNQDYSYKQFAVRNINSIQGFEYRFYSMLSIQIYSMKDFFDTWKYYGVDDDGSLYLFVVKPNWDDSDRCWLTDGRKVLIANICYIGDAQSSLREICFN